MVLGASELALAVEVEVGVGDSQSSWLQPRFELPTEEEALRALAYEITARTPPLNNLHFTNRNLASFLGSVILNRAADTEGLARMGEMEVDQANNQIGARLAWVSFCIAFFFQVFYFAYKNIICVQVSSLVLYISNSHSSEQAE